MQYSLAIPRQMSGRMNQQIIRTDEIPVNLADATPAGNNDRAWINPSCHVVARPMPAACLALYLLRDREDMLTIGSYSPPCPYRERQ